MAIIVNDIRIPLDAQESDALQIAFKRLGLRAGDVRDAYIVKKSLDARHRNRISLVYSVGVELDGDEASLVDAVIRRSVSKPSVALRTVKAYVIEPGADLLGSRPVIAGFGPAGMFAGLLLARFGYFQLIVERGADVDGRVAAVDRFWREGVLDTETNVQFGEGGAGTFSDGKLTTRSTPHAARWCSRSLSGTVPRRRSSGSPSLISAPTGCGRSSNPSGGRS